MSTAAPVNFHRKSFLGRHVLNKISPLHHAPERKLRLLKAIERSDVKEIEKLINEGVDLNKVVSEHHTDGDFFAGLPLINAVRRNSLEIVKLLLNSGANPNVLDSINSVLEISIMNNQTDIVRELIKHHAVIRTKTTTETRPQFPPVTTSIEKGNIDIFRILLNSGQEISPLYPDDTIFACIRHGRIEILKELLKYDIDYNYDAYIKYAESEHRPEIITLLESHKNRPKIVPLFDACESNDIEQVTILLDTGIDVNSRIKYSVTPLYEASKAGNVDIVKLLIEKGADVNAAKRGGWTALYAASFYGHLDVVRLLLDKGAEIEGGISEDDTTPLYIAMLHGYRDVMQELYNRGAVITPIITARAEEMTKSVKKGGRYSRRKPNNRKRKTIRNI